MKLKVENVVATMDLGHGVNLNDVFGKLPDASYDPTTFPGVQVQYSAPKALVVVFATGKMVCHGCRAEDDAEDLLRRTCDKMGEDPKMIEVSSLTLSTSLAHGLDLDKLQLKLDAEFDDGLDAVVWEDAMSPIKFLFFANGRIVGLDADSMAGARRAARRFADAIEYAAT